MSGSFRDVRGKPQLLLARGVGATRPASWSQFLLSSMRKFTPRGFSRQVSAADRAAQEFRHGRGSRALGGRAHVL